MSDFKHLVVREHTSVPEYFTNTN